MSVQPITFKHPSIQKLEAAMKNGQYFKVSNPPKMPVVSITGAEKNLKNEEDGYLYLPGFRICGRTDEVRHYFQQINQEADLDATLNGENGGYYDHSIVKGTSPFQADYQEELERGREHNKQTAAAQKARKAERAETGNSNVLTLDRLKAVCAALSNSSAIQKAPKGTRTNSSHKRTVEEFTRLVSNAHQAGNWFEVSALTENGTQGKSHKPLTAHGHSQKKHVQVLGSNGHVIGTLLSAQPEKMALALQFCGYDEAVARETAYSLFPTQPAAVTRTVTVPKASVAPAPVQRTVPAVVSPPVATKAAQPATAPVRVPPARVTSPTPTPNSPPGRVNATGPTKLPVARQSQVRLPPTRSAR